VNMTHQTHELFPDTPAPARPRERRRRSVAQVPAPTVRLRLEIELPADAPPPAWLADVLRGHAPKVRTRTRTRPGGESVESFLRENLRPDPKAKVTLREIFQRYHAATLAAGGLPLPRNPFSTAAVRAIHAQFGVTGSNDIAERGKIRRGFRGLRLVKPDTAPSKSTRYAFPNISSDGTDGPR
jgi:hypothetical protein